MPSRKSNFDITIEVGLGSRYSWPNGKPIKSENLDSGKVRHVLEDGRAVTVDEPDYKLDYISTRFGSAVDDTYEVRIAICGVSAVDGFYDVWNFDINEFRSYAFRKTVRVTHLETGEVFTGAELEASLRSK